MTIARRWKDQGNEIYWPVLPQFLDGCTRAYPDINFMDWRTIKIDYENRNEHDVVIDGLEYRVVPLRWNVENLNVPYSRCMETKYSWFGWDFREWKEKAHFKRDKTKEKELFDNWWLTGEYIIVNKNYQSDFKGEKQIKTDSFLDSADVLKMKPIKGFSLFDWCYLLEHAKEIHTVSTSLLYILEMLDLKCPIHLYARPTDPNFDQVKYLFTKNYILHS